MSSPPIDETILLRVDTTSMPPSIIKKYLMSLRRLAKKSFPHNRVLVVEQKVEITILR